MSKFRSPFSVLSVEAMCISKAIPGSQGRKEVDETSEGLYTPANNCIGIGGRNQLASPLSEQVSFNLVPVASLA
jgi:hypothetical protein